MSDARRTVVLLLAVAWMIVSAKGAAIAQSTASVHVVTYLDLLTDRVAKARAIYRAYREATAKSAGNKEVGLYQEIGRPGRFVVRETWVDQDAFAAHAKSQAAKQFDAGLSIHSLAPPDQRVHSAFVTGVGPSPPTAGVVHVFTHVDVPPTRQGDIEPLLKTLQAASVLRPTANRYDVLQQSNRKNHFTVAEAWAGLAAFSGHNRSEAQMDFRRKLATMLGALYDQRLYRAVR